MYYITHIQSVPYLDSYIVDAVDSLELINLNCRFQSISTIIIAYMFYCAYSTVLKIRLLNLYYLAPHHMTNEYSLIFSGMMVCRLTPAMCLNFLSLVHMDSHVIKEWVKETSYTQVIHVYFIRTNITKVSKCKIIINNTLYC